MFLLYRKLELGEVTREMTANEDFLANVKDANIKEIIPKVQLADCSVPLVVCSIIYKEFWLHF